MIEEEVNMSQTEERERETANQTLEQDGAGPAEKILPSSAELAGPHKHTPDHLLCQSPETLGEQVNNR